MDHDALGKALAAAVDCETAAAMAWRLLLGEDFEGADRQLEEVWRSADSLGDALDSLMSGR